MHDDDAAAFYDLIQRLDLSALRTKLEQHRPRLPADEQEAVLNLVTGVACGSVVNGYTAARALGASRSQAQRGAATGPHLAAVEYVRAVGFPPDFSL
jgi:hypothetical protein